MSGPRTGIVQGCGLVGLTLQLVETERGARGREKIAGEGAAKCRYGPMLRYSTYIEAVIALKGRLAATCGSLLGRLSFGQVCM